MANTPKHKLKPIHLDVWSSREKLSLACSVVKNGDQNWVSVSRAIKPFAEGGCRPPDWFSQKNCALQYADLLEKVETPKRKRGDKDINETPGEQIVRKLTIERLEELKNIINEEGIKYKKLKHEIECIRSGQFDDCLPEMWENIQREKRAKEEAATTACERRIDSLEGTPKTVSTPGILKIKQIPLKQSRNVCSESSDEKTNDTPSHTIETQSSKLKSADGLQQLKKEAELEHSATLQAYQHLQVSDATLSSVHPTPILAAAAAASLSSTSSSSSLPSSTPVPTVLTSTDLPITVTTGSSGLTISLPSKPPPISQPPTQQQHIPTALPNIATLSSSAPPLQTLPSPVLGTQASQLPTLVALPVPKTLAAAAAAAAAPAIVSTIPAEISSTISRLPQDITSPSTSAPTLSKLLGSPAQSKIRLVDPRSLLEMASNAELSQDKTELKIEDLIAVREESNDETINTQNTENLSTSQECVDEKPIRLSHVQDEDTSSMGSQAKDLLLDVDDEKLASVAASLVASKVEQDEETQQPSVVPLRSPKTELDEACAAAAFLETTSSSSSSSQTANISDSPNATSTTLIQPKTDETSKDSLDETLAPEGMDSPAALGNKFISVDEEISISIKDEPSSPSSSVSSKLSEPTSSAGRPRGRGRGRKKGGINRRTLKGHFVEDELKKEDGGSSKHSEAELTEDDSARESDDPANTANILAAQSALSSVLSDSIPNSPASLSHYDTEDEKAYRTWKKSIMLVYRAAATHKYANVFLHPVKEEIAPGYHSIVHRPMDLSAIKKNIETGVIRSTTEFQRDMMLMFTNAIMYNSSDHNVYSMAREMYDDVMQHIEQFVSTQLMVQTEVKMLRPSRRIENNEKEEETKKKKVDPNQDGGKKKKRPKSEETNMEMT